MSVKEYEIYSSEEFNAAEVANQLILETNNSQDTTLDLKTSIKKLGFNNTDISNKIEELVKSNTKPFIEQLDQLEKLEDEVKTVKPSVEQLKLSYDRLDNEIVKPYYECLELQNALKKINQTNKILRNLSYVVYIISKIEEIDKSEASLNSKPLRRLNELCKQLYDFNEISNDITLQPIKIVRDNIESNKVLVKRCENVINVQIKNLSKEYPSEKHVFNLIGSIESFIKLGVYNENKIENVKKQVIDECLKSSITLILRNLNNTKHLASYIRGLDKPAKLVIQLGGRPDVFWKDLAVGIEPGVKDIVNKGGPIVKNLKAVKSDLETEIRDVIGKSGGKLEITMMLNSLTNFERRK